MFNTIKNSYIDLISRLIKSPSASNGFRQRTVSLMTAFLGTDFVMWGYTFYCYYVFKGFHIVTIGGLIFSIIHTFAPVVFYQTQSHTKASIVISFSGLAFQFLFCVYSGGVYSPAAIWLSLHPVILGFFASIEYIYLSVVLNTLLLLGLHFIELHGYLPASILPVEFKNSIVLTSYIGLDFLIALFTINAYLVYKRKNSELARSKELSEYLLRILAHDISNPLTVIRFYSDQLGRDHQSITPQIAERLKQSSEDIERITESVTMWIAHRDGKIDLQLTSLDPKELVNHLQNTFEQKLKQKNIEFICNIQDTSKFVGDRNAVFYQVFNNLLSNAIKFSQENSKIVFTIDRKNEQLEFSLRDFGVGINENIINNIFSTNIKTNRRGTKNESGTGFGLPIVGLIVLKIGGNIQVKNMKTVSPDEQGTLVIITLPIAN